jgi:hypothetical protein
LHTREARRKSKGKIEISTPCTKTGTKSPRVTQQFPYLAAHQKLRKEDRNSVSTNTSRIGKEKGALGSQKPGTVEKLALLSASRGRSKTGTPTLGAAGASRFENYPRGSRKMGILLGGIIYLIFVEIQERDGAR